MTSVCVRLPQCLAVFSLLSVGLLQADSSLWEQVATDGDFTPYRSLTYTADGIREVRETARTTERGKALANEFIATARLWTDMTEEEVLELIPTADAVFATGNAGDPKTGDRWPPAARAGDVCSLDRPGTVRSPHTGDIYGIQEEGELYYDDGSGWVREEDGQIFYFKGLWNTWIMAKMLNDIDDMAIAYMLTGDEAIARRALFMLDAISTLRGQRPDDVGPIDWPGQNRSGDKGFFHYAGNGANFRVYMTVLSMDLLAASGYAHEASPSGGEGSIFTNVRENYMKVYEMFYKTQLHTFYNHTLVLYANEIAQGVLFGDRELLKEGIGAVFGFMDNTLNRDGDYFENAGGYNDVGVNYAAQMMLPLMNYDPARYDESLNVPAKEEFPNDMAFGDDPRWRSAAIFMQYRPIILGRKIQYGDYHPDRHISRGEENEWVGRRRAVYLRLLYQQTERSDWREQYSALFHHISERFRGEADTRYVKEYGMSQWFDLPEPAGDAEEILADLPVNERSDMIPGRVIGILRSGEGLNRRAAFIRGGVNSSHGHDDKMGIILYGRGMSWTGLYGYRFAGTPNHFGWGTRGISHKTLVVNQDLPAVVPYKYTPSSDVLSFVTAKADFPASAQLMELSNRNEWRFVTPMNEYRRMVWLVDVSSEQFYFVDIFRARGGEKHDYVWTGPFSDTADPLVGFELEGVDVQPREGAWTLAGLDPANRNESYNQPGQSWGERLDNNTGYIRDLGIEGENLVNRMRWNPPPENGYGFIWDIRTGQSEGTWKARWPLVDRRHQMEFTMLNTDPQTVIRGLTPTTTLDRSHVTLITRRESARGGLRSRYVSLTQAGKEADWAVAESKPLEVDSPQNDANIVGVEAKLVDGRRDVIITNSWTNTAKVGDIEFDGSRAFIRYDQQDEVEEMMLEESTFLQAGTWRIRVAEKGWSGRVEAVDATTERNRIKVSGHLPVQGVLDGQGILLNHSNDNPWRYTHNQYYEIRGLEHNGESTIVHFGEQDIIGGRIEIESVSDEGLLGTRWPNMIIGHRHTRYYAGREIRLRDEPGTKTRVERFTTARTLNVDEPKLFKVGDHAEILMIQPGDEFYIPSLVRLRKTGNQEWQVQSNQSLELTLGGRRHGNLIFTNSMGEEYTLARLNGGAVSFRLPIDKMPGGVGTLRID